MKPQGSAIAFARQRNRELISAFRKFAAEASPISLHDIALRIINSPSPRFWVSEERAAIVVSLSLRGRPVLDAMRPSKREMFQEIIRRVTPLIRQHPDIPLLRLVARVVHSQAPKLYMEPSSVIALIRRIRAGIIPS